ncbi:hypothetical protein, partial [Seonamhaeicola sp.]
GIRQQRKQHFEYHFLKEGSVNVINDNMENVYVNGAPNKTISSKIVPNRLMHHPTEQLQPIEHPNFNYVKIETNVYIGSPF